MKDENVQAKLKQHAKKFINAKKYKPEMLLDDIMATMGPIGGITGLHVRSYQTLSLYNHQDAYTVPIRFEEHSDHLSSFGHKQYAFFEELKAYLTDNGVSPHKIEYHLGKDYASKHHAQKEQKAA